MWIGKPSFEGKLIPSEPSEISGSPFSSTLSEPSSLVWFIIKAAVGIRVSEEDEIAGLDASELGMDAYPDFSK